ncbi:MAG: hypothetical protein ACRDP6_48420, partial [Actinoallomurus sp.]
LTHSTGDAASHHAETISIIGACVILVVYATWLRQYLSSGSIVREASEPPRLSLRTSLVLLILAGVASAFVSDWFVNALEPTITQLHISQAFAGLVIVAIAGNAVENVVGIQLALKNQSDYALSVILQSPLQIALVVAPALVLLSPLVGASFTLVLSPLLIAVLIMAVVITVLVVLDGESNWLEGATLIVLYAIIATAFWWG